MVNREGIVPLYTTKHKVRFYDTDLSATVFFTNHIKWFDSIAIMDYFEELGIDWNTLIENHIDAAVANVSFSYKQPVLLNDYINLAIEEVILGNKSVVVKGSLYRDGSDDLIAQGEIVYVFVDARTRKSVVIPDIIREKFFR